MSSQTNFSSLQAISACALHKVLSQSASEVVAMESAGGRGAADRALKDREQS